MPLFAFDRTKKVKLQEVDAEEAALSPAIAPEPSEAAAFAHVAEVVKSRKTRPFNWILAGSAVAVFLPVVVLLYLLAADSFARDYFSARYYRLTGDNEKAVMALSSALTKRNDTIALEERAGCYRDLGDRPHERADLWALIERGAINTWFYERAATAEAREGNISKAVEACMLAAQQERARPMLGLIDSSYRRESAAYNLLLLGEPKQSEKLVKEVSSPKNEKSGRLKVLKILMLRESGDSKGALENARSLQEKHVSLFKDSRFRNDEKIVPASIQGLMHLDRNEPKEARALLEPLGQIPKNNKQDNSEPILDVLEGWLLLEEGRLTECLSKTESALKQKEMEDSVAGLNIKAALHLVRKNCFAQLKKPAQAAAEEDAYKRTHCSGLIFTPIAFRPKADKSDH